MQALISRPMDPGFSIAPKTTAEWKARVNDAAFVTVANLPQFREALGVSVEPTTIGGSCAQPASRRCGRSGKANRTRSYMADITAPEAREYHAEVSRFFDLHLGRE